KNGPDCGSRSPGPVVPEADQEHRPVRGALTERVRALSPEDVADHVDDIAVANIDQQRIVIIADPAQVAVGRRQAIGPGIVDPVIVAEQQAVEIGAYREAAIAIGPAIRHGIAGQAIDIAVILPIIRPVIPVVLTPVAVPSTLVGPAIPIQAATIVVAPVAALQVVPGPVAALPLVGRDVALSPIAALPPVVGPAVLAAVA